MKILIADDDPQLLRALRITLTSQGYEILTARDGTEAVSVSIDKRPDVYLLDLGMPSLDGIEVIRTIRGWSKAPILVVSGRAGSADKVEALDAGADDYVTKPFSIEELLARVRAMTRRVPHEETMPAVRLGDITIDLAARSVTKTTMVAAGNDSHKATKQIRLTPTEWEVIEYLIRNNGKLVTRQMLLTHIWGSEHVQDTGYLRLYISQLRKKLEDDPSNPRHIITEAGMGYRLENLAEPPLAGGGSAACEG